MLANIVATAFQIFLGAHLILRRIALNFISLETTNLNGVVWSVRNPKNNLTVWCGVLP